MKNLRRNEFLYGVNLGGWLVAEKWMTPSVFAGSEADDEYTLTQSPGGRKQLKRHRQSFIQEADIAWLADHGINALRVPVGYWLFDGLNGGEATVRYLDQVITWAEKYHMRVLIDVHATPMNQNGQNHSGRIGRARQYYDTRYHQKMTETLAQIAEYYRDREVVWGIELLHEPRIGLFQFKLRAFYQRSYEAIRQVARPGLVVVFHDAFSPRLMSGALWAYDKRFPVVMDIHWCQFLGMWRRTRSRNGYFRLITHHGRVAARLRHRHGVIIGEWNAVLSERFLQGASDEQRHELRAEHLARQLAAYSATDGWFYWSYKGEDESDWNFRWLVEQGLLRMDR